MCGIVCIISNNNILELLLESLEILQNRGYDSTGIGYFENNNIEINKYANLDSINKIKNKINTKINNLNDFNIGIGHTRWATHGKKIDINSHPHLSNNQKISVVHNGIIENFLEIKTFLLLKGFNFYSETDTEVICNLLQYNFERNFKNTIKKTLEMIKGKYSLGILNLEEKNKIYCVRKGSPLLIGQSNNLIMITSEKSGFLNKVDSYFVLNENDICECKIIYDKLILNTENNYKENKIKLSYEKYIKTPYPYKHWTIKEIHEQIDTTNTVLDLGNRLLDDNTIKFDNLDEINLKNIDNLILLGCGTSLHACEYGINFFKELCDFNLVVSYDGGEFSELDIPKNGSTMLILLSQSGETQDLYRCMKIGKDNNTVILSLVNVVNSLIARESDYVCYLKAGREEGVASTKCFTNQCILLSMLSIWFSQIHNKNEGQRINIINDLRNIPSDIKKSIDICNRRNLYLELFKNDKIFILGKGKSHSIAKEGSLKIKEISYIFTEGYSSSSLKHGTFALLDEKLPVIILAPNNNFFYKNLNTYHEIHSRNSPILVITDKYNSTFKNSIILPENKTFQDLLSVIPLQFIAYHLSINKNINPDRPRNLAKCVTVE